MPRPINPSKSTRKVAARFSTSFTPEMANAIREWGKAHNASGDADALRMLVTWALSQPFDRATAMAFQKVRSDLWIAARRAFTRAFDEVAMIVVSR
jgi:hypothetical protein